MVMLLGLLLPLADIGDWSDAITVTVMSLAETPPLNDKVTGTIPDDSELV